MFDFVGIGVGPFNLSLASLIQDKSSLNYMFFEKKNKFDWHAGIQLPYALLQVPFMADLVSLVEPTSAYSFLNYLKHHKRLYKFYFRENFYIPRQEYNHYCQWVVENLDCIQFNTHVLDVKPIEGGFELDVLCDGEKVSYKTRQLVLGVGTVPYLPDKLKKICAETRNCLHSSEYLQHRPDVLQGNVVLIGSGQSAAEIFLDLFNHKNKNKEFYLYWLTRSAGFFPMENTPLGLEHFSPDYMNYFYYLPSDLKIKLLEKQVNLYKGISGKTIRDIYEKLYHYSIGGMETNITLSGYHQLEDAEILENRKIRLFFKHIQQNRNYHIDADTVIAATGYHYPKLCFLDKIKPFIEVDENNYWKIKEHFEVKYKGDGRIYIQNMEIFNYGVGTPDLGLGAYRSANIINQLVGKELFKIDDIQSFQQFGTFKEN